MKVKDYVRQYGVSEELFQQVIDAGILEERNADGDRKKDEVLNILNTCTCLSSLGLSVSVIKDYIELEQSKSDTSKARCKILRKARNELLKNMHDEKDALDCIDCIMKSLKSDTCKK